jgi:hypothetical protein
MRLCDYLKLHKLDYEKLKPIIVKAIKDRYPLLFNLDEYKAFRWAMFLDLQDKEFNNLIIRIAKYTKLWIFS